MKEGSIVPARVKHDSEAGERSCLPVEVAAWTERLLAALGNGVKGGMD